MQLRGSFIFRTQIIIHIQNRQLLGVSDHCGSVIMTEDKAGAIAVVGAIRIKDLNSISDLRGLGHCFRILIVFDSSVGCLCCDLFPVDNTVGRFPSRIQHSVRAKIQLSYIHIFTDIHSAVIRSRYKASIGSRYLCTIVDGFHIAIGGQRTCPPPKECVAVAGCGRQRVDSRAIVIV